MLQQEFTIRSVAECNLYGKLWHYDTTPKAVVVLIHGFGEHCSRYTPYIKLFESEKVAFISMDLIGHGRSEGKRGVIKSYKQLLDDVDLLIDKAEALFPGLPKFLYGHSMGGNIAFNYLLQRNYPFKSAIISSPWLQLTNDIKFYKKIAVNLLKYICPNITVNGSLNSKYISSKSEEVIDYDHDPLNHGRISFRLLSAVSQHGRWAMNNTQLLNVPTLLMHGNRDQITSHMASKATAQELPHLIIYDEYDDMYHEIHNDKDRKRLATQCIKWINHHL